MLFAIDPYDVREAGPPRVTDEGVLFSFEPKKEPVDIRVGGEFNNWEKIHPMKKNRHGIYVYLYNRTGKKGIVLEPGQYRYRYLVNGMWVKDPLNPRTVEDQYGTKLSIFDVKKPIIMVNQNPVHFKNNFYVFYYKNDKAEEVYLVGDFNNWDPYSLPMQKNKAGLWEVVVDLVPGSHYYRFYVDGVYRKDPLGRKLVYDRFDNVYSAVKIPLM
ncbi:MAG: hypothetical protein ACOC7U_01165 [Spirochaetota bacterium]